MNAYFCQSASHCLPNLYLFPNTRLHVYVVISAQNRPLDSGAAGQDNGFAE